MIEEIAGLGFKRVELSHGIRVSLVPGIMKAVDESLIEVSSVHNFCPLPVGINHAAPNLYQPSTADMREMFSWNRYTLQTLDFAEKTGAKKVVMHSGSVQLFFKSPEQKLKKWIRTRGLEAVHLSEDESFVRRRNRAMRRIRKASDKPEQRVKESYQRAMEWASERGLKLCVENREGLSEMPFDSELVAFLDAISGSGQIGYWHDTGHAQIKHQFGLLDHRGHLAALRNHLAGFHLHDVTATGVDHQTVGTGTVDFKMIAEFVRPEHELVLELSPQLSSRDVLASREYICNLLD